MKKRAYQIAEVARLAGVSSRTLRYYDKVGLLAPSSRSVAGYRLYTAADLLRLQQIMIGRSLGLSLEAIRKLLDDPLLDRRQLLLQQRQALVEKARATEEMIRSVDVALTLLNSEYLEDAPVDMKKLFDGFDPAQHEQEARERWGGSEAYAQSRQRTRRYKAEDWRRNQAEWQTLMSDAATALRERMRPDEPRVMDLAERHRLWLERWFFACPPAMHAGFADLYETDTRFASAIDRFAPQLTGFWSAAIRANAARQLEQSPEAPARGTIEKE